MAVRMRGANTLSCPSVSARVLPQQPHGQASECWTPGRDRAREELLGELGHSQGTGSEPHGGFASSLPEDSAAMPGHASTDNRERDSKAKS